MNQAQRNFVFPTAALIVAALVAGCQATPNSSAPPDAVVPSTQAATCDKCRVTWTHGPLGDKGGAVGSGLHRVMICPDCTGAIDNLFATGTFEDSCTLCQSSGQTCDAH